MKDLDDLELVATATLTHGAKTSRVVDVKTPRKRTKAIKPAGGKSGRRVLTGRTATITVCVSLDVADLEKIDAAARAENLNRSAYLVECWRKARGE